MTVIHENYLEYQPPGYTRSTIAELLSNLPKQYLTGIQSVVLTNSAAIPRGKTRRIQGKKHVQRSCLGFYHPKWKGEPAWIELVVDNIVTAHFKSGATGLLMLIPIVRNLAFATTLFHEVGHQLDHTTGASGRNGEAAADAWNTKLMVSYFRKHYWYLMPFVRIVKALSTNISQPPSTL